MDLGVDHQWGPGGSRCRPTGRSLPEAEALSVNYKIILDFLSMHEFHDVTSISFWKPLLFRLKQVPQDFLINEIILLLAKKFSLHVLSDVVKAICSRQRQGPRQ